MSTFYQCIESLAVCHVQDEPYWEAARTVAQQDIAAYLSDSGPELADKFRALNLLATEFARTFPDDSDPALIRSCIRRHIRSIGHELKHSAERRESTETVSQVSDAPATVPVEASENPDKENEAPMTEQQTLDTARLCQEADVSDKLDAHLLAQDAQKIINELHEETADVPQK